jgi:type I restriction enzyme M protein
LGLPYEGLFPKDKPKLRWSIFSNLGAEEMYKVVTEEVFPFIKGMGKKDSVYSQYMKDAIFVIPTASLLARVVAGINGLLQSSNNNGNKDKLGDLYEYLLSKIATAGTNGQFRTPRHIIDMIVRLVKPTPEDIIVDPAAGLAGFLVSSGEYLKEKHSDLFLVQGLKEHFNQRMFHGFERANARSKTHHLFH